VIQDATRYVNSLWLQQGRECLRRCLADIAGTIDLANPLHSAVHSALKQRLADQVGLE